ncbi:MAG: acetoin utilization protein AcuC [Acidiferrobacterales bacterium]
MPVRVYVGEELARYGFGEGHPFGPDRLDAFWNECKYRGLDKSVDIGKPVKSDEAALLRFHTGDYIDKLKTLSISGTGFLDFGDTPAFKGVFEAASYVAGTLLDATREVIKGVYKRCFVPIAGLHHARRDTAAGFCAINDIGVCIETLRANYGIQRVGYVDIDAHHGDGVYYSFENDPDLIIADLHEDGRYLYPGTGAATETGKGEAKDTKLNVPMAPGADDEAFHQEWPRVVEFLRDHRPEIILLQAGADSIKGDPITHMAYSPAVHHYATKQLCTIADEVCGGRFIAMGGGGYNRGNIALAWNAVVEAMLDQ